jgi:hypothetical protein
MQDALTIYFDGEKYAGLILAAVAVCGIAAAAILFRAGPGFRSFAITLAIIGLAEIALGLGLYARTGPQVQHLEEQMRSDLTGFYQVEGTRMARVQRNFVIVEYVELFVIITTAVSAVAMKARSEMIGVALGLLINGAILLAFDVLAERRGADYLEALTVGETAQ